MADPQPKPPNKGPNAPGNPARPPDPTLGGYAGLNAGLSEPAAGNGGTDFPGRVSGTEDESRVNYKKWYETEYAAAAPEFEPWLAANPGREDEIQAIAWTYRNSANFKDDFYDAVLKAGLTFPGPSTTSGSGPRGGGGGGGASKAQQYAAAEASVRNRAGMLGLKLDDGGVKALAKTVVDGNWSADQLDDYLVPAAVGTNSPGMITASVRAIDQMAAQQLLNVSDATKREWAGRIASGEMDMDGVRSLIQAQAVLRHGWAASQIAQGISVRDMLLPSRDRIASELEVGAETIDLMDSKWLSMTQTVDDKGVTRAATDSEVTMRARKLPEWSKTRRAGDMMATYAVTLRDYLGG